MLLGVHYCLAGAKYVTKNNTFSFFEQFWVCVSSPPGLPRGCFCQPMLVPTTGSLQGQNMLQKKTFFHFWGSKNSKKKVEIEGVGPIWRDPRRNSVQKAVPGVPYGGMATHLVTKRCDLGSLGVPGPASTPLESWPKAKGGVGDHLVTIVSAGTKKYTPPCCPDLHRALAGPGGTSADPGPQGPWGPMGPVAGRGFPRAWAPLAAGPLWP